jgi:hypothetical protein
MERVAVVNGDRQGDNLGILVGWFDGRRERMAEDVPQNNGQFSLGGNMTRLKVRS